MNRKKFPHYPQLDSMDCGPACLRMVAKFHGRLFALDDLRSRSYLSKQGVSLRGISEAAEHIGLKTLGAKLTFEGLQRVPLPAIVHWQQNHFVVVHKLAKNKIYVADPATSLLEFTEQEFKQHWLSIKEEDGVKGVVLLLMPTPDFYREMDEGEQEKSGFRYIFSFLQPYRKYILQLLMGLLLGSLLQLALPFLTQSIVDVGINGQNISFINLILIAQLMLIISRTAVDLIRSWILLNLGTRVNISIISDFLIKLMKLPLSFFDTKTKGDLLQRVDDHSRIERFLTTSTFSILFSLVNLLIFGVVLAYYNLLIFGVFFLGSALYTGWILLFQHQRRVLDYKLFNQMAKNQSYLIQLITGMQEIKLHNAEQEMRWQWERIQARLFGLQLKSLSLSQYQQTGAVLINESKNLVITFLAAKAVLSADITLGMMLAVQYIVGQLNAPINQLLEFLQSAQTAKISTERLGEIHARPNENKEGQLQAFVSETRNLSLRNLSFRYEGSATKNILKHLNLEIPEGKVTAIVGASGSGKTTLLKLLLKFYLPSEGEIQVGETNLALLDSRVWRERCGAVLQDGYIFNDTIIANIAVGESTVDLPRFMHAIRMANAAEFIEQMPMAFNTRLGESGQGLSQGQRQRILIARAIYKNPEYLFFDEATNALDSSNEKTILENLNLFFKERTVVVVAHRLSTVKNAHQIVVMDRGQIAEIGEHQALVRQRGLYYELVKNQLELEV